MSISFSGLASGLDTSSWIESLVALKRAKVTVLQEQKEEEATYKKMIQRDDELINWEDSSENIHNKVRGLYPNSYCLFDGTEMKILKTEIIEKEYEGKVGEIVEVAKDAFFIKCRKKTLKVLEIKPFSKKL